MIVVPNRICKKISSNNQKKSIVLNTMKKSTKHYEKMYYKVFHSTEHYEEKSICKIRKKNETRIFKNNMHLYAYKFENLGYHG